MALTASALALFVGAVDLVSNSELFSAVLLVLTIVLFASLRDEARSKLQLTDTQTRDPLSRLRRLSAFISDNFYAVLMLLLATGIVVLSLADVVGESEIIPGTLLILSLFAVNMMRRRLRIREEVSAHDRLPVELEDRFVAIGSQLSKLANELGILEAQVQARAATARKLAEESSKRQAQAERDRWYALEQQKAVAAVDTLVQARAEPIIQAITLRARRDQFIFLVLGIPIGILVNAMWRLLF
jgi:hypothetical protein